MLGAFGLLRRFRFLRGTPFDPFGYGADRRLERALIAEYERDMDRVQAAFAPATRDIARGARRAAARDPRLRPGEGGGGRGGGGAARRAAGGAGGRRMAEGAGGRVGGRVMRRVAVAAALLASGLRRAGCRWSGRRWCRAAASTRCRARPRFVVRTLPAGGGRRAARGGRRPLRRGVEPLHRRARHPVAARRAELRPAVARDQRRLHGRRARRQRHRPDRHPLARAARLLGLSPWGFYRPYAWGWYGGAGYPVSDYPDLAVIMRPARPSGSEAPAQKSR